MGVVTAVASDHRSERKASQKSHHRVTGIFKHMERILGPSSDSGHCGQFGFDLSERIFCIFLIKSRSWAEIWPFARRWRGKDG